MIHDPNLKGKQYGISPQYPKEVLAKRKELVPILKKAKSEGKIAYLRFDKLFIDGSVYVTEPVA